jgi:hypothetical protein
VSHEAVASSKHSAQQQQRGAKRKRSGKASTPPPDTAADEAGEDAGLGSCGLAQQPPGKPLPAGSRPGWLVQALQGGSAALNKRHARGLPDDLSQPQQVEFMLGCADCDHQQVCVCAWVVLAGILCVCSALCVLCGWCTCVGVLVGAILCC